MQPDSPYHPEVMSARRNELIAKRDAILAVSNPIREKRDALVQAGQSGREPLDEQLKAVEADLGEVQHELAFLNIALSGHSIRV